MTSPEVRLVLDDPERVHVAREPVRGRVEVVASDPWLGTVELAWVLHSTPAFGRERRSELEREQLYAGEVKPGAPGSFELHTPAPGYPPTYRGDKLAWEWELVAIADDGAGDQSEDRRVVDMRLAEDCGMDVRSADPGDPARVSDFSANPVVLSSLVAAVCIGLGVTGFVVDSAFMKWFFSIWGVLSLLYAALALHTWREHRRIGKVQIAVDRAPSTGYREAGGRETAHVCTVWTLPGADVRAVRATVDVYEQVEGPQQSDGKRIETSTVWTGSADLEMREPGTWHGPLPLPEPRSVPFTVNGPWMRALWRVTAMVITADDSAYPTEAKLDARPAQGPGARS